MLYRLVQAAGLDFFDLQFFLRHVTVTLAALSSMPASNIFLLAGGRRTHGGRAHMPPRVKKPAACRSFGVVSRNSLGCKSEWSGCNDQAGRSKDSGNNSASLLRERRQTGGLFSSSVVSRNSYCCAVPEPKHNGRRATPVEHLSELRPPFRRNILLRYNGRTAETEMLPLPKSLSLCPSARMQPSYPSFYQTFSLPSLCCAVC